MADLDLAEAVEQAAQAVWESDPVRHPWVAINPEMQYRVRENVLPAVTAAAPLIEAQVRARIAADIEARQERDDFYGYGHSPRAVSSRAARIARGDAS